REAFVRTDGGDSAFALDEAAPGADDDLDAGLAGGVDGGEVGFGDLAPGIEECAVEVEREDVVVGLLHGSGACRARVGPRGSGFPRTLRRGTVRTRRARTFARRRE